MLLDVTLCVTHLSVILSIKRALFVVQGVPINESYCGEAEQNGPLVGNIAIESSPIMTFPQTQLTSVAAAAVNGHAIIYLGTRHGHLKKVDELLKWPSCRNGNLLFSLCSMSCIKQFNCLPSSF